ncbi:glycosyltransferase [Methylophaga sp.]|uniref:glycosyltransferase n=1 Tax=Methylophaga sp. TaxID=2024840 RepID=UPI003A950765
MEKILGVFPSVGFWVINGNIYLDRKFYDGLMLYKKLWRGSLVVFMRKSSVNTPKFGMVKYDRNEQFKIVNIEQRMVDEIDIGKVDVVLASADDFKNLHISKLCKKLSVPCVYYLEYILETRLQINQLSSKTPFKKLKTIVWLLMTEIRRKIAIKHASALQANGTPVFFEYKSKIQTLLYFDTRCTDNMLISENQLSSRLATLNEARPLRLVFSGRLNSMKGVDDLMLMTKRLVKRNIDFTLDIFGEGELLLALQELMNSSLYKKKLRVHGAVDFANELIPYVQKNIDIFVCCHKQSDPSCTYLETYSCGVPILGYNNKAHAGILQIADVGWSVQMGNIENLCDAIVELNNNRAEIVQKSKNAIAFAKANTFYDSFKKRIDNCRELVK